MDDQGTNITYKRQVYRFWRGLFIRLAILISMALLFYFGYCFGLWGRRSLLLQYLFQCNCPSISEEWRYPKDVDVIISACHNGGIRVLPSGRLILVHEKRFWNTTAYLLDLQTRKSSIAFDPPFSSFLTDELWFIENGRDSYILDQITGAQYPIKRFVNLSPDAQINGETNIALLVKKLQQAERIYLTGASTDTVVALVPDFRTHLENNFYFNRFDMQDFDVEAFLHQNNIIYQTIIPDIPKYPHELISPNGKFIARPDGIYLSGTNNKIVDGYSASSFFRAYSRKYFIPRGWVYDGTGVIYTKFLNPCLIETNFFLYDDPGCFFEVSQPVIVLKIPEDHLLPVEIP